jgi:hypothetical protein
MNNDEKYIMLLETIMTAIAETHEATIPSATEAAVRIIEYIEANFTLNA